MGQTPEHTPTYAEALELLREYNTHSHLINHALAVSEVMRHLAEKYGKDPEKWAIVGLVHDLDYERFPEEHCRKTEEILTERGWPAEYIRAVVSHGYGMFTEVEPQSPMEKSLYAVDELTGLVAAAALVRPSKSVSDLKVKSVMKKWKDKSFAAGVDRTIIENGAAMMEVEIRDLVEDVITGMRRIADQIGL